MRVNWWVSMCKHGPSPNPYKSRSSTHIAKAVGTKSRSITYHIYNAPVIAKLIYRLMLVSANKATKQLGVSASTLRLWESKGLVNTIRTPGNVRLYDIGSLATQDGNPRETRRVFQLYNNESTPSGPKGNRYIYCRVSSRKQQADLDRQIAHLSQKYPGRTVIKDIGSGVNYKVILNYIGNNLLKQRRTDTFTAHRSSVLGQVLRQGNGQGDCCRPQGPTRTLRDRITRSSFRNVRC